MPRTLRSTSTCLLLALVVVAAACGPDTGASPGVSAGASQSGLASESAPGSLSAGTTGPSAESTPPASTGSPASPEPVEPSLTEFWALAARALSRTGRLRVVSTGSGPREMRFEPRASAVIADGTLSSVCFGGASYVIQGIQSSAIPGKWACGGSAFASSFRKTGQPAYAWNTRVPTDTRIKEVVTAPSKDRWQWDYTATSPILAGPVKATLLLDPATGRIVSGSRTDPTGTTRYTFSYTTIFSPIGLP